MSPEMVIRDIHYTTCILLDLTKANDMLPFLLMHILSPSSTQSSLIVSDTVLLLLIAYPSKSLHLSGHLEYFLC